MKTTPFVKNISNRSGLTKGILSGRRNRSGFITKTALVALVLVGLVAAGFVVRVKGKSLSESVLPTLSQVQNAIVPSTEEASPVPAATPDPVDTPLENPAVAPTANALPAPVKAVAPAAPAAPKIAPAGMVYLAKRITVTKETGLSSYPKGTLVVVKSKAGGKIRGSINGVNVELSEAEATTVLQE